MQIQIWTWTETNWSLIFLIVVGSGALAWLGDVIGMKFGKRRISLFGLRPKSAGHVITALTGIAIAILTVIILASISESVRTALFSLKYIQKQLNESRVSLIKSQEEAEKATLELETSLALLREQESALQKSKADVELLSLSLNTLKNDKQILENEKNNLSESIEMLKYEAEDMRTLLEQMREGTIVVRVREVLAQDVIPPDSTSADVSAIIEKTTVMAGENIAERLATLPENVTVSVDIDSVNDVISSSSNAENRRFLRLSAAQNITTGSPVLLLCDSWNSYQIYNEGDIIHRRLADPNEKGFNAEEFLHAFLRELRFKAIREGVSPDPVTNNVGALDAQKFFETVEALSTITVPVIVNGIAVKDIYTEGPVNLRILIEE